MSEFEFSALIDLATKITTDSLNEALDGKKYASNKCGDWIDKICNTVIEKLRAHNPNFKYIVSSFIIQKTGAGVHLESGAHWDAKTDGSLTIKFENDSLICLTTVIGVGL